MSRRLCASCTEDWSESVGGHDSNFRGAHRDIRICNALEYDPSDVPFFTLASWLRVGTKYGMKERGLSVRTAFGQNGAI